MYQRIRLLHADDVVMMIYINAVLVIMDWVVLAEDV